MLTTDEIIEIFYYAMISQKNLINHTKNIFYKQTTVKRLERSLESYLIAK